MSRPCCIHSEEKEHSVIQDKRKMKSRAHFNNFIKQFWFYLKNKKQLTILIAERYRINADKMPLSEEGIDLNTIYKFHFIFCVDSCVQEVESRQPEAGIHQRGP
jgi:hypothetical protein